MKEHEEGVVVAAIAVVITGAVICVLALWAVSAAYAVYAYIFAQAPHV